ncbi:primosomal replication protein [Idiomarina seosinensis]|uniref:primosomal replication protein PriC n=1 Tax=Idiomarina seosinensis TaxID=281739 RepID=UPI00384BF760
MQQIDGILKELTGQAKRLDEKNRKQQRQLSEQWFAPGLFSCRSSLAIDYVSETCQLWQQLQSTTNAEAGEFIAQQFSNQLLALKTALNSHQLPREQQDRRVKRQSRLAELRTQLATYHGYEQRLGKAVADLQQSNDSNAAQQQQKRLNRCQLAITDLQAQIQKLEEGR